MIHFESIIPSISPPVQLFCSICCHITLFEYLPYLSLIHYISYIYRNYLSFKNTQLFYLKGGVREGEREKKMREGERETDRYFPSASSFLQMPTAVRAGLDQSQGARNSIQFLT